MPQRIHQRLPYRSSRPTDFGSRYEDNWMNLSPEEAHRSEAERQYERKKEGASERRARQQHQRQKQRNSQERFSQQHKKQQHKKQQYTEAEHEGTVKRSWPQYTRSSSRNSYQSPTESWSSKRSDRARLNSTLESSDGSLDLARPARRGSAHRLPRDSVVRELQKKLMDKDGDGQLSAEELRAHGFDTDLKPGN